MWLVVATCALGMGVDILDVKLITHYAIPTEIERYVVGMVGHVMFVILQALPPCSL